jgi:hypothetical protein
LITIVGNLVPLARGVVPQHQECLHDAIISPSSSIHILHSPDVTEQGLDQLNSIHPPCCLVLLNSMGLIPTHINTRLKYSCPPPFFFTSSTSTTLFQTSNVSKSYNTTQPIRTFTYNQFILDPRVPTQANTSLPHHRPQSCLLEL